MALKRLKTKNSKRLTCRMKYKIDKKVREHNRKLRRKTKNQPKKNIKQKVISIPNACPFKDELVKEAKEQKLASEKKKELSIAGRKLASLAEKASHRDSLHCLKEAHDKQKQHEIKDIKKEHSLKQYFKEFQKVIDNADVLLEIVDARDPLGTRCSEVERALNNSRGNKRLILVINKADLIPRENLQKWLEYFRRFGPAIAFKASTQEQSKTLGRRKLNRSSKSQGSLKGSVCIGAEILMSMLGNYCRNNGIKTSIRVGVVGIPNVGKSSIINSLTRDKSCSVGSTPGVTRTMQEVELDSKIKLIDCPGIVFPSISEGNSIHTVLKNAERVENVKDPFPIAETILKRGSKSFFSKLYDIEKYDSFEEFFAKKASRMGKFLRKGVPDVEAAARSILNDWNNGKIKYCTQVPLTVNKNEAHISSAIVHEHVREFDVDNFESMESEVLEKLEIDNNDDLNMINILPGEQYSSDNTSIENVKIIEEITPRINRKRKIQEEIKNVTNKLTTILSGNEALNKNIKEQFKKNKKQKLRREKNVEKIVDVLTNFNITEKESETNYSGEDLIPI